MSDQDTDEAEIVAVIEAEVAAWVDQDLEKLKACWLPSVRNTHVTARITTGLRRIDGYDQIVAYFQSAFRTSTAQPGRPQPIRCENWKFSISSDMAWVTLDLVNLPEGTGPGRLSVMKILEKHEGSWKVAANFGVPHRIGYYKSPWVQVDGQANVVEQSASADTIFGCHPTLQIIGKKLCGRAPNDNRKLKQALAKADELNSRLKMNAPMPLVLTGPYDDQVSLCWVTIADMTIVVLLGDEALLEASMNAAGDLFGLSEKQLQVAASIAQGNDLTETADLMGVQPSTVKTHVRRMFERLKVNSQPALVRALLKIEAPYN